MGRDSVVGISDSLRAGRYGDQIQGRAETSVTRPDGPGTHPASYTIGTGSLFQG
jgi:hypothetical protein